MFLLHHVTFSINSLCHFFGRRPFSTGDESRNLAWLAPLAFGEAWHNNHHAFPTSARHGLGRWQVDPGAWLIARAGAQPPGLGRRPDRARAPTGEGPGDDMKFLKRDTPEVAGPGSSDDHELPIPGYDQLEAKQISDQLARSARRSSWPRSRPMSARTRTGPGVLDKLRYMRGSEPLPGYDALTTEQIATELAGADARTVRAVRDYERKFQHRRSVLDEAVRVLPNSRANPDEERAREGEGRAPSRGLRGSSQNRAPSDRTSSPATARLIASS